MEMPRNVSTASGLVDASASSPGDEESGRVDIKNEAEVKFAKTSAKVSDIAIKIDENKRESSCKRTAGCCSVIRLHLNDVLLLL